MTRSTSATDARAAVFLTLGQFRMLLASLEGSSHGPWASIADESPLALATVSNVVAHIELFVTLRILKLTGRELSVLPSDAGQHMLEVLTKEIEGTWDGRLRVLNDFSGVSIKRDWSNWQAWDGFVAARNAWAHGQGRLTRRQVASRSLDSAVRAAGLVRLGDRVKADASAVSRSATFGAELIDIVDEAVARGSGGKK